MGHVGGHVRSPFVRVYFRARLLLHLHLWCSVRDGLSASTTRHVSTPGPLRRGMCPGGRAVRCGQQGAAAEADMSIYVMLDVCLSVFEGVLSLWIWGSVTLDSRSHNAPVTGVTVR